MITEAEPDDLAHRCAIEHLVFINEEGGKGTLKDHEKKELLICRSKNRPSTYIRWDHRNKCYVCRLANPRVEGGCGRIVVSMSWRVVAYAFDILPLGEFHYATYRIVSNVVLRYDMLCCAVLSCPCVVLCVLICAAK